MTVVGFVPATLTSADLTTALLTADDLAEEGVGEQVPIAQAPYLAACVTETPTAHALAVWEVDQGRWITHVVESFPRAADVVESLRGRENCMVDGGKKHPAAVLGDLPVDAQHGWCFERALFKCGSAVAKGDLLLVIEANADTLDAAQATVARLVPKALTSLERLGRRTAAPAPVVVTTTAEAPKRTSGDLVAAALTPADLEAEGKVEFQGAQERPYLELCLGTKPSGKSLMTWGLPGGRSLVHVVESYEQAADKINILRGQSMCLAGGGDDVVGPTLGNLPVDAQHSWCYDGEKADGCGGVVAKDGLLMAVVVEAESVLDARAVVARLMPVAVAALDRV